MSNQRQSLGTAWVTVDPDGKAINQTLATCRDLCWVKLECRAWQLGEDRSGLRRFGYRIVKVELRRV